MDKVTFNSGPDVYGDALFKGGLQKAPNEERAKVVHELVTGYLSFGETFFSSIDWKARVCQDFADDISFVVRAFGDFIESLGLVTGTGGTLFSPAYHAAYDAMGFTVAINVVMGALVTGSAWKRLKSAEAVGDDGGVIEGSMEAVRGLLWSGGGAGYLALRCMQLHTLAHPSSVASLTPAMAAVGVGANVTFIVALGLLSGWAGFRVFEQTRFLKGLDTAEDKLAYLQAQLDVPEGVASLEEEAKWLAKSLRKLSKTLGSTLSKVESLERAKTMLEGMDLAEVRTARLAKGREMALARMTSGALVDEIKAVDKTTDSTDLVARIKAQALWWVKIFASYAILGAVLAGSFAIMFFPPASLVFLVGAGIFLVGAVAIMALEGYLYSVEMSGGKDTPNNQKFRMMSLIMLGILLTTALAFMHILGAPMIAVLVITAISIPWMLILGYAIHKTSKMEVEEKPLMSEEIKRMLSRVLDERKKMPA